MHTVGVRLGAILGLLALSALAAGCFESAPATRDPAAMLASARFAPDAGPLRFHLDVTAVLRDGDPAAAERPYVGTPIHAVMDGRVELRRGLLDAELTAGRRTSACGRCLPTSAATAATGSAGRSI